MKGRSGTTKKRSGRLAGAKGRPRRETRRAGIFQSLQNFRGKNSPQQRRVPPRPTLPRVRVARPARPLDPHGRRHARRRPRPRHPAEARYDAPAVPAARSPNLASHAAQLREAAAASSSSRRARDRPPDAAGSAAATSPTPWGTPWRASERRAAGEGPSRGADGEEQQPRSSRRAHTPRSPDLSTAAGTETEPASRPPHHHTAAFASTLSQQRSMTPMSPPLTRHGLITAAVATPVDGRGQVRPPRLLEYEPPRAAHDRVAPRLDPTRARRHRLRRPQTPLTDPRAGPLDAPASPHRPRRPRRAQGALLRDFRHGVPRASSMGGPSSRSSWDSSSRSSCRGGGTCGAGTRRCTGASSTPR